jgi:hypothetical protein
MKLNSHIGREGYGHMGPFGLSDGDFDRYMVYFFVVVSALSFGVKISVGTSGNCEDYAMGGEDFRLLRGFLDLWRRWGWRIGFYLDLRISVVWH